MAAGAPDMAVRENDDSPVGLGRYHMFKHTQKNHVTLCMVMTNIAMENGPFIDVFFNDLPINNI